MSNLMVKYENYDNGMKYSLRNAYSFMVNDNREVLVS